MRTYFFGNHLDKADGSFLIRRIRSTYLLLVFWLTASIFYPLRNVLFALLPKRIKFFFNKKGWPLFESLISNLIYRANRDKFSDNSLKMYESISNYQKRGFIIIQMESHVPKISLFLFPYAKLFYFD